MIFKEMEQEFQEITHNLKLLKEVAEKFQAAKGLPKYIQDSAKILTDKINEVENIVADDTISLREKCQLIKVKTEELQRHHDNLAVASKSGGYV